MKKALFICFSIALMAISCNTRTTPKEVINKLQKDRWEISRFLDSTNRRTFDYEDVVFKFDEMSALTIVTPSSDTFDCSYDVPEYEKNPAHLILNVPQSGITSPLSDNWKVIYLTNDEFRLERYDGKLHETDQLIFSKI